MIISIKTTLFLFIKYNNIVGLFIINVIVNRYQDSGYAKDTLPLILKIFDLKFDDLSKDLKSFIKVCFEKYAEDDEYSSEVIDGELKKWQNKSYLEDLEAYQALVNNQLVLKYQQIIDIVHKILVPRAKKIESQLYYHIYAI